jgi:hypothetical protein
MARVTGRRWMAIIAAGVLLGVAASAEAAQGLEPTRARHSTSAAAGGCPVHAVPLGANSVASAATLVLSRARKSLKPIIESASMASVDHERGGQVRTLCGTRMSRETVIVYLRDRALGRDESLAQSFSFVSRFPSGFRVWYSG